MRAESVDINEWDLIRWFYSQQVPFDQAYPRFQLVKLARIWRAKGVSTDVSDPVDPRMRRKSTLVHHQVFLFSRA